MRTVIRKCFQKFVEPSQDYRIVRWLFLRWLAVVYCLAFVSFAVQIPGLIGPEGILPAADYLNTVASNYGVERFWLLPTVFWLGAQESCLLTVGWGGAVLAVLLFFDIAPTLILFLLWAGYLSLVHAGRIFMMYQWDSLLLETGFLALFIAPRYLIPTQGWRPSLHSVPRCGVGLMRWLLFRLMFLSGAVKLLSGDDTWRLLTALTYHYWTQPLPNPISWWVAHLPEVFHQASTGLVLFMELAVPFFIFGNRSWRQIAFFLLTFLQGMIILTGNYGFFNILTIGLGLWLLDDPAFPSALRPSGERARVPNQKQRALRVLGGACCLFVFVVSGLKTVGRLAAGTSFSRTVRSVTAGMDPFLSVNTYGLFAVMTRARPEIILEGSQDGRTWRPYEFRWKAGRLDRPPPWVMPHMPRLDWQMWFAALGTIQENTWILRFEEQLLKNSEPVKRLLASTPFGEQPPRLIRARRYLYRFSTPQEKKQSGAWWQREEKGLYHAPIALEEPSQPHRSDVMP